MTTFDSHILETKDNHTSEVNLKIYDEPDLNLILMASVYSVEKLQKTLPQTSDITSVLTRINSEINEIKIKHDLKTITASEVTHLMHVVTKLKEYHDSQCSNYQHLFEAKELSKLFPGVAHELLKTSHEIL